MVSFSVVQDVSLVIKQVPVDFCSSYDLVYLVRSWLRDVLPALHYLRKR